MQSTITSSSNPPVQSLSTISKYSTLPLNTLETKLQKCQGKIAKYKDKEKKLTNQIQQLKAPSPEGVKPTDKPTIAAAQPAVAYVQPQRLGIGHRPITFFWPSIHKALLEQTQCKEEDLIPNDEQNEKRIKDWMYNNYQLTAQIISLEILAKAKDNTPVDRGCSTGMYPDNFFDYFPDLERFIVETNVSEYAGCIPYGLHACQKLTYYENRNDFAFAWLPGWWIVQPDLMPKLTTVKVVKSAWGWRVTDDFDGKLERPAQFFRQRPDIKFESPHPHEKNMLDAMELAKNPAKAAKTSPATNPSISCLVATIVVLCASILGIVISKAIKA